MCVEKQVLRGKLKRNEIDAVVCIGVVATIGLRNRRRLGEGSITR